MRADLRLCQIRSGQMKKDPPRSESDPLKVHISEIITALCPAAAPASRAAHCSHTVTIRIANSDPHFRGELRIAIRKYAANCE